MKLLLLIQLYENTKNDKGFNVPKIYWSYTSKDFDVRQRYGISIREYEKLKDLKIDLKILAENLIQHFLKQAVEMDFSMCYASNLFVDKQGNIVPVDFGIMGRLDKNNNY